MPSFVQIKNTVHVFCETREQGLEVAQDLRTIALDYPIADFLKIYALDFVAPKRWTNPKTKNMIALPLQPVHQEITIEERYAHLQEQIRKRVEPDLAHVKGRGLSEVETAYIAKVTEIVMGDWIAKILAD